MHKFSTSIQLDAILFMYYYLIFSCLDYRTKVIDPASSGNTFNFRALPSICQRPSEISLQLQAIDPQATSEADLTVFFNNQPPSRQLFNQFSARNPLCIAFLISTLNDNANTTLIYSGAEPLITISDTIEFNFGGDTVNFNPPGVDFQVPQRLQICVEEVSTNSFEAVLFDECVENQRLPITISDPSTTANFLSILHRLGSAERFEVRTLVNL